MKLNLGELSKGYEEVIKEATVSAPNLAASPSMPTTPPPKLSLGLNPMNWAGNAAKMVGNEVSSQVGNAVGQLAPMMMLPMLASGLGSSAAAPAPIQSAQSLKPNSPAGFKYGSEKTALLGALVLSRAADSLMGRNQPMIPQPQIPQQPSPIGSKDPMVEKALENPEVQAYIHKLINETQ